MVYDTSNFLSFSVLHTYVLYSLLTLGNFFSIYRRKLFSPMSDVNYCKISFSAVDSIAADS